MKRIALLTALLLAACAQQADLPPMTNWAWQNLGRDAANTCHIGIGTSKKDVAVPAGTQAIIQPTHTTNPSIVGIVSCPHTGTPSLKVEEITTPLPRVPSSI